MCRIWWLDRSIRGSIFKAIYIFELCVMADNLALGVYIKVVNLQVGSTSLHQTSENTFFKMESKNGLAN